MQRAVHKRAVRGRAKVTAASLGALVAAAVLAAGCLSSSGPKHQSSTGASLTGTPKLRHHHKLGPPAALRVVAVTPFPGAQSVPFASRVTVRFSTPLAASTATPVLSPAVPGSWVRAGADELVFEPTGNFVPFSKETLTVPAGAAGPVSTRGVHLTAASVSTFTVAGASILRLQQLLAELGYLPVSFTPTTTATASDTTASDTARLTSDRTTGQGQSRGHRGHEGHTSTTTPTTTTPSTTTPTTTQPAPTTTQPAPTTTTTTVPPGPPGPTGTVLGGAPGATPTTVSEPRNPYDIPLTPVPGQFSWRFPNIPASLAALWAPGEANTVTLGAVMQFELAHGLATDGEAGPEVWSDLLKAVAERQITTQPYDYVEVLTSGPEYLRLWRDGTVMFTTLVNTGIPQAPTQLGTWPVYARYTVTTMSGTNPDGTHYSDPGIPWVSYFHGGDALHGFLRSQYGFPQSLGCVEMPYSSAETVFPFTPIGTLVSVL